MTELAVQLAAFLVTVVAMIRVLRAFPRLRIHDRRGRGATILVAILIVLAGPLFIAARSFETLAAEILPAMLLASASLLGALGIAAVGIALRADPARGRSRCPKCWYDLAGAQAPVCPECGRESTARQRARTRRSPRLAVVGVACLLLSLAGLKAPQVQRHGWTALIPTTAMILALEHLPDELVYSTAPTGIFTLGFVLPGPPAPPPPAPANWDLHSRVSAMWPWQRELLQWRVRRIFKVSRHFDHIERAESFADPRNPPRLGDESVTRYIELVLGGDAVLRAKRPLDGYFPDHVSASVQPRIADAVENALVSDDVRGALRASGFMHLAPDHAARLADAVVARIDRAEVSFVYSGVGSLAPLAQSNDHAWARLREMLADSNPHIRYYAAGALRELSERREQAIDAALPLLMDQHEDVARNALASLGALSPDICVHAGDVWAAARRGPNIAQDALRILAAAGCRSAELQRLLRDSLASDKGDEAWLALQALRIMDRLEPATIEALRKMGREP